MSRGNPKPWHGGRQHCIAQARLAHQDIIGRTGSPAALDAETGRGIALWIEIDDQHEFANRGERRAEIDCRGGFADAAFLIGNCQHPRRAHLADRKIGGLARLIFACERSSDG